MRTKSAINGVTYLLLHPSFGLIVHDLRQRYHAPPQLLLQIKFAVSWTMINKTRESFGIQKRKHCSFVECDWDRSLTIPRQGVYLAVASVSFEQRAWVLIPLGKYRPLVRSVHVSVHSKQKGLHLGYGLNRVSGIPFRSSIIQAIVRTPVQQKFLIARGGEHCMTPARPHKDLARASVLP